MLNLLIRCFFIISLVLVTQAQAQDTNSASNFDLRGSSTTFIIEKLGQEKLSYALVKDGEQGHRLEKKSSLSMAPKVSIITRRISNSDAQALDHRFVSLFVNAKYGDLAESDTKKKCTSFFKLAMRGEVYIVCSDEQKKIKIVNSFLETIKQELIR